MHVKICLTFAEGHIDFHVRELLIARMRSDQFTRWTLINIQLQSCCFSQRIIVGIFKHSLIFLNFAMLMPDPAWQRCCSPVHSQGPKQASFWSSLTLYRAVPNMWTQSNIIMTKQRKMSPKWRKLKIENKEINKLFCLLNPLWIEDSITGIWTAVSVCI